jgi:hypothetical protein
MKKLLALVSFVGLSGLLLSLAVGAPARTLAAKPLAAHQEPRGLAQLVAPGDRSEVVYTLDTPGIKSPVGSLYVRNDLTPRFERFPLRVKRATLNALLPDRLIRGHRLLYYAVVRDPQSGRSVTVPTSGARAPSSAWILAGARIVRLGAHRFGHPRAAESVVAQIGAAEVGWQNDGDPFGPQTFVVGRDRSIWLDDSLNDRLLMFRPGSPDIVARSVPLPARSGDSDFALGPGGTFYVKGGIGHGLDFKNVVYQLSANGSVRWQTTLAGALRSSGSFMIGANSPLRTGPDGTLYCLAGMPGLPGGELGWMPVATPAGRPLSVAQQIRGTHWPYQPVAGGVRLVSEVYNARPDAAPREVRVALIDRAGHVVRAWRIVSRTDINFGYTTPELVRGDPVIVLDVTAGSGPGFKWEELVLRLGPNGARSHFSLRHAVYGDNILADVRVGPDGKLYQLGSSPTTGVVISRYSLTGTR